MAAEAISLLRTIDPTERQYEFLAATERQSFVLYGGAAGGGKSYILRWAAPVIAIRAFVKYGIRNGRVGLFCEDYPTLRDRQISRIKYEFPAWLGELKETREAGFVFQLREQFGSGFIALRNLDDPSKYNSTEFLGILVDELTRNPSEVWDELRKRRRWPGLPAEAVLPFAAGSNPGGIGHAWVKKLWLDGDLPRELWDFRQQFRFIRARASDNPHLTEAYYRELLSLPPLLRKAYADGDWNIFQGQFFSEWREELHVCQPFHIPRYWRRFAAMDWGYAKPACVLWFAVSPEGIVYVYRELYVTHRDNTWLGDACVELTGSEDLSYRLLDPACWDDSRGESIADQLAKVGWRCEKAENSRINGWARTRQYLSWERDRDGNLARKPQVVFFSTCTNAIRTIPGCTFDKHQVEDLDTDGEDHPADTLRYGLMSRPATTEVPLEHMNPEYAEAVRRAAHQEKPPSENNGEASGY